jgi:Lanthionine synthetase C-like protein
MSPRRAAIWQDLAPRKGRYIAGVLFDPARHEPLLPIAWDEGRVRTAIAHIVNDTESRFSASAYWPIHPSDADGGKTQPLYDLYFGACGVLWALHYLRAVGACDLRRSYAECVEALLPLNRESLASFGSAEFASYLGGDTGILLLSYGLNPARTTAQRLETLIESNLDHPARELMWGSPGTMLAALFLHRRDGDARWADLFRTTARKLWSQLIWSPEYRCHYWTQDMYGQQSTYLDAVHGFVATALPLIGGRHLLGEEEWVAWEQCITNTVRRTATTEGPLANWRAWLDLQGRAPKMLMQFCHGAPGFVVCLADFPATALDDLLIAGGEAVWHVGPLAKGANLCHGTGGNGYAFLKLYARTGDGKWLDRARAFAMHAIAQSEADARQHGQRRYSLWTGDLGLAIYLWDCIHGSAEFPTLDVYFA